MATLPDLATFDHWASETADPDSSTATLALSIRGNTYTWRSGDLSMWAMVTLRRLDELAREAVDKQDRGEPVDDGEITFTSADQKRMDLDLLGDNMQQMMNDGVRWVEATHVSATLMAWYLRGHRAAMDTWARKKEEPADPPARAASTKTAGSSTRKTPRTRQAGGKSSATGGSSKRTSTASTTSTSPTKASAGRGRRAGS